MPGVTWCGSALEAVDKADVAVVVTEWNEFRALDLDTVKERMRGDVLVDLRNSTCRRRRARQGSATPASAASDCRYGGPGGGGEGAL